MRPSSRYLSQVSWVHMSNDCQTYDADYIEIRTEYFDSEEMSLTHNDMESLRFPVPDT